jgi:hypothetical protein
MEEEEESGEKVGTGAGRGGEKLIHLRDKWSKSNITDVDLIALLRFQF